MKLNLHPKGIPKQKPLGADTPLKKGGVVVGMRKEEIGRASCRERV